MKVQVGKVYKNSDGDFYTPAQSGDYWIVDMWECNKKGFVKDIEENPCPVPVSTGDLKLVGKSEFNYSYPEWNPMF